jgi:hypothetical protein
MDFIIKLARERERERELQHVQGKLLVGSCDAGLPIDNFIPSTSGRTRLDVS